MDDVVLHGYVIRYGDQTRHVPASQRQYTLGGLLAGTYSFTVAAETVYQSGRRVEGEPGSASATVTTVPERPKSGEPTSTFAADGTLTLDWGALEGLNGGSAITGYTYALRRGDGTVETGAVGGPRVSGILLSAQHEDLRLTVVAENAIGPSASREYSFRVERPPPGQAGAMYLGGTYLYPGSARRVL